MPDSPFSPFASSAADRIDGTGEVALIRMIRQRLGNATLPSPQGIGDDCAVWPQPPQGEQLLFTTDALVYGRHFDATCPPQLAAAKLLKRNLSDIAAMGGTPNSALLALTLAPNTSLAWLEGFIDGLRECALHYATPLTGGDITAGTANFFAAHITLIGHAKHPLLRTGAKTGDHLFATGALGGSIHGHHLHFTPRLAEGRWLAAQPDVRAMIDITDGLAKDLPELLNIPPKTGNRQETLSKKTTIALLDLDALPLTEAALTADSAKSESSSASPREAVAPATEPLTAAIARALTDGEDYELLFAVDAATDPQAFIARWQTFFGIGVPPASGSPTRPQPAYPYCIGRIAVSHDHPAGASRLYDAASGQPLQLDRGGFEHL